MWFRCGDGIKNNEIHFYGGYSVSMYNSFIPYCIKLNKAYKKLSGSIPIVALDGNTNGYNQIAVIKNSGCTSCADAVGKISVSTDSNNSYLRYMTGISNGEIVFLSQKNKVSSTNNGINMIPDSGFDLTDAEFLVFGYSTYGVGGMRVNIQIT